VSDEPKKIEKKEKVILESLSVRVNELEVIETLYLVRKLKAEIESVVPGEAARSEVELHIGPND
jgi:hypothetical protein